MDAAGNRIAVRNPTNAGVVSVGGGKVSVDFVSITDNQSFTITMGASDALVIIRNQEGVSAVFHCSYASATITEISDPSSLWVTTDTDPNPGWAIFKSANSSVFTIKNYSNATKQLYFNILGLVTSATAPA